MHHLAASAVVLLFFGHCYANSSLFHLYSMIGDIGIYQNITLRSFASENVVRCAVTCAQTSNCVAFLFSKTVQQCILQDSFLETDEYSDTSLEYQYWSEGQGNTGTTSKRECPSHYTYYGPRSEYCYKFIETRQTLENASLTCQEEGGHLIHVETHEERDVIQGIINASIDLQEKSNYYTGAIKEGDTWRWGVNGVLIDDNVMSNTAKDHHEAIKITDRNEYVLEYCEGKTIYPYICEFELIVY